MRRWILAAAMACAAAGAGAQSLTPEQLKAMIDQRVAAQNPYQELLNDPDPARSMAAMEIMMESGDAVLFRMALEFGVTAANPTVRRRAVEAFMSSGPVLTARFDGTNSKGDDFVKRIRQFGGNIGPDGIAFIRFDIGQYEATKQCYLWEGSDNCAVSVNADGVFLSGNFGGYNTVSARLALNESGELVGSSALGSVQDAIPTTIRIID
ncbi:MAG: hypothetical protein EP307_13955 [Rhodobacteraceae bacterium]|nr:MAG: hypothetical protein EP307_13955 [Paracoccaceae bacterium]